MPCAKIFDCEHGCRQVFVDVGVDIDANDDDDADADSAVDVQCSGWTYAKRAQHTIAGVPPIFFYT